MRRATLLPGLALVLLASGCGGGGSTKPAVNVLQSAADKTIAAGTAKVTYSAVLSVKSHKRKLVGGSGVVDTAQSRSRVTTDLGPLFAAGGITVKQGDRVAGVEIVDNSAGLIAYYHVPFFSRRARPPRPWVRVDLAAALRTGGASPALLTFDANPVQYLEILRTPNGAAMATGKQRIDGVETVRYSGTVDLVNYPAKIPAARRNANEFFGQQIVKVTMQRFVPVEVWIDPEGRVRRLTVVYAFPTSAGPALRYELTFGFSDFGGPPPVELPPASQVTVAPSLTRLLSAGG